MPIGVIIIMVAIVVIGVVQIVMSGKPKKAQDAANAKFMKKMYTFLSAFFLTQDAVNRIYSKLAKLSVFKKDELKVYSVTYYLTALGTSATLAIASFFLFKDFLSVLLCVVCAMVMNTVLIDKKVDKNYYLVLRALSGLLSSLRQEYLRLGSVVEAFNEVECAQILHRHVDDIRSILTSSDAEVKMQEFYASTPYRTFQTLVGVSYMINNQGDSKDEMGQSNFIKALTIMSEDVNYEIQSLNRQQKEFGVLEYLPLLPLLGMPLLEGYFTSIMPGTALIYQGMMGFIARTITVVLAIFAYMTISRINMINPVTEDGGSNFILNALEYKFIKRFLHVVVPKGKAKDKIAKKLKDCLSSRSLEYFYMQKTIYSIVAFCLCLLIIVSSVTLGREFIRESTQQLSLVATDEMDGFSREQIRALDEKFLALEFVPRDEEIKTMISAFMPGLSDLNLIDQVSRLQSKRRSVLNTYFKWWYIWLAFITGIVGWKIPNMGLSARKAIVDVEAENDFLQLQTLVTVLMSIDMDTIDVLNQLSQNSRIHKNILLYCYHSYPSDPLKELTRLQSKTPLIEFKRFIGKLKLTVSDLSLREAFSDLMIERSHILKLREVAMESSLKKRRSACGMLSMMPIGSMVLGSLLIPLGTLGFIEFQRALGSLG